MPWSIKFMFSSQNPMPLKERSFNQSLKKRVIVISGPTASGKTRLSLELAKIIGGEIISADSMQVYRHLDIGTAKVSREERCEIPHHLIDICDLNESFNVVNFYHLAREACYDILSRNRVPIVVGGTGFYIHALLYGPPEGPPASKEIRDKIEGDLEKFGVEALYEKLQKIDPVYASTIGRCDKHKIIRSLEIITLSGKKVSDFSKEKTSLKTLEFDFRCWFIYFPKEILYPRIEMRCDEMVSRGLIEETEHLCKIGLLENLSASQAIGYRQCIEFLESKRTNEDWETFVWAFKKASRHYAKRQFTWFRNKEDFHFVNIEIYGYQKILEMIIQDFESR